jgi:hypothetical protein
LIDGCGIAIRMLSEQELSKMMGTPVPQEPATMDRKRLNDRREFAPSATSRGGIVSPHRSQRPCHPQPRTAVIVAALGPKF